MVGTSTALHTAAKEGAHDDLVKILRNGELDINVQNEQGCTPLHYAALHGNTAVAEALLERGAEVMARNKGKDTPLHYACGGMGNAELCALLIGRGGDVNAGSDYNTTPLHLAASSGQTDVLSLLLSSGAHQNVSDDGGNTPLHDAARNGSTEACVVLVESGANASLKNKGGKTPLDLAQEALKVEIVQYLEGLSAPSEPEKEEAPVNEEPADDPVQLPVTTPVASFMNVTATPSACEDGGGVSRRDVFAGLGRLEDSDLLTEGEAKAIRKMLMPRGDPELASCAMDIFDANKSRADEKIAKVFREFLEDVS